MTDPPSDAGAFQLIATWRDPGVAEIPEGVPGRPAVVAVAALEATESPKALVALTVKVYTDELDSPVIVQLVVAVTHVCPELDVTVY